MACAELVLDARRLCTLALVRVNKIPRLDTQGPERHTSTGRPDENHPDALLRLIRNADLALQPGFELRNALLEPGDGALEVRDRGVGDRGHYVDMWAERRETLRRYSWQERWTSGWCAMASAGNVDEG